MHAPIPLSSIAFKTRCLSITADPGLARNAHASRPARALIRDVRNPCLSLPCSGVGSA